MFGFVEIVLVAGVLLVGIALFGFVRHVLSSD